MPFRRVFRYFARVLIVTGAVASVMGGCSRQGEGERCDYRNAGHSDCDDGLSCTVCAELQDGPVDRCCKPDKSYTDSRCQPGRAQICYTTEVPETPEAGGTSGMDMGEAGTGGETSSGATGGTGGTDANSSGTGGADANAGAGG